MGILAPPAGGATLGLVGVAIVFTVSRLSGGNKGGRDASTGASGPAVAVPGRVNATIRPLMTRTLDSTPAADGFAMPAEFSPHAACWMLWPERPDNWRDGALPAQRAFVEVAAAIARFEPVRVGVSASHFDAARAQLPAAVKVVEMS